MSKGFCTVDDVADFLGLTLTEAQQSIVDNRIGQVEAFIENATGQAWLTSTVLNETTFAPFRLNPPSMGAFRDSDGLGGQAGYVPVGADIILAETPVSQVIAVKATAFLGGDETTLIEDLDYEVRSLDTGLIRLTAPAAYYRIRIDYVPFTQVPQDICLATIALTAIWSRPMLQPSTYGLASYELPDLKVTFQSPQRGGTGVISVPPDIQGIIDHYRYRTVA